MNFKYKCLILTIVICIMLGLTAVSASDNHTDTNHGLAPDEEIEISDDSNEKLMETQTRTYDDFYKDIKNCTDTFDMQSNYKHVESDDAGYLEINKTNFMIKGNNHVIDGSSGAQGIVFTESEGNLTICDLTFVNYSMSVIDSSGNLTLINVNFTRNGAENPQYYDGIIAGHADRHVTINNCSFDLNYNSKIINADNTDVSIYNSRFSNTRTLLDAISIYKANLEIENCTFENLSARYGGAINFKGADFTMRNTTFNNVRADLTGGAIIIKFFPIKSTKDAMLIDGCAFTNTSSGHNGGALYVDLDSASEGKSRTLNILNSNFTDITSDFGGAIADQGGILNIINDNFIKCNAKNLGGAIYTSWANLTVNGTSFLNCSAGENAGALYFDYGRLMIYKSNFTDNKVNSSTSGKEAIIYANDVDANITCSTFKTALWRFMPTSKAIPILLMSIPMD